MYRTLAEAAANCTRNIAAGYAPIRERREPVTADANLGVLKRYRLDDVSEETDFDGTNNDCVQELSECLKDGDKDARIGAVCSIAEMGRTAQEAVPALIEALSDENFIVRIGAITALGEIGAAAENAVEALIEILKEDDLCGTAAIALGRIGSGAKPAVPALMALRKRKNAFLTWCADEAIRAIKRR